MKTFLTASAIALALTTAAVAQQVITTEQLKALDTDGDGAVQKTEFDAFMGNAFTKLDGNGDGYVTAVEGQAYITPEQFAAANSNGDSGLSAKEFMDTVEKDFASADRDLSGALN